MAVPTEEFFKEGTEPTRYASQISDGNQVYGGDDATTDGPSPPTTSSRSPGNNKNRRPGARFCFWDDERAASAQQGFHQTRDAGRQLGSRAANRVVTIEQGDGAPRHG